jgi:hypothetical protein
MPQDLHDTMLEAVAEREELRAENARLNAEVNRWHRAYEIAHEQATHNGALAVRFREALLQIAADQEDHGRGCFLPTRAAKIALKALEK